MDLKKVKELTEKIITRSNALLESVYSALSEQNEEVKELDYSIIENEVYLMKIQLERLESLIKDRKGAI